ncbi:MAG: hypothetical protein AMS15_08105 [Planctomycetes bacterium DG_23]|nr:MAG: hypothetical protein AMS15_08105 [Planctomycetes bacterium DG_23]
MTTSERFKGRLELNTCLSSANSYNMCLEVVSAGNEKVNSKNPKIKKFIYLIIFALVILGAIFLYQNVLKYIGENKVLKQVIARLEADSRIAEVLVTEVHRDQSSGKTFTTIKFLEYDTKQSPLEPRYFTFPGNIIQFQSLVIRFDDFHIRTEDPLKGKSAYLFWKVFMLDGPNTQDYEITKVNEIPQGYKIEGIRHPFEEKLWEKFWGYALNPEDARRMGIKNAQIEAPGTMFIPGTLYTIKIEHDGGMRIDTQPLPAILRGERLPG